MKSERNGVSTAAGALDAARADEDRAPDGPETGGAVGACAEHLPLVVKLPTATVLDEAVTLLKGIADPTRLKILLLLKDREVCVHQIVDALQMSQSAVSHQLRTLRAARLVDFDKRGRHVYYRLADEHVRSMIEDVLSHSEEIW